jgi:hypothetical protein
LLRVCDVDLQTVRSGSLVRRVSAGITYGLGIVNWEHPQKKLGVIRVPTFLTDQQIEPFGLNDFFLQALQLELLSTPVTNGN